VRPLEATEDGRLRGPRAKQIYPMQLATCPLCGYRLGLLSDGGIFTVWRDGMPSGLIVPAEGDERRLKCPQCKRDIEF